MWVTTREAWIGSSEVIESLFGKFKNLEKDRSRDGFTTLVLSIADCLGKTNAEVVTEALMRIKTKDVIVWAKQALGFTFTTRRRNAFKRSADKKKNMDQDVAGILEGEAAGS